MDHQRYQIHELNPLTYLVIDLADKAPYMIHATAIKNGLLNAEVTISAVTCDPISVHYVIFNKELLSFQHYAAGQEHTIATLKRMLTYIQQGTIELRDPVELLAIYGGTLHNEPVSWPSFNQGH
jgi:hypothetical protein